MPEIATTPLARRASYPWRSMDGIVVAASVAADPVEDPQIAAKPAPATDVAMARPPRMRLSQAAAALKRSSVTPLSRTSSAISRNIGMVTSS